jgi:16S rRNA (cytosine967-C5)-methyltransferase
LKELCWRSATQQLKCDNLHTGHFTACTERTFAGRKPQQLPDRLTMFSASLIDSTAELLAEVLKFAQPSDRLLSQAFADRRLGQRERAIVSEAVHAVVRRKLLFQHLANLSLGMESIDDLAQAENANVSVSKSPGKEPRRGMHLAPTTMQRRLALLGLWVQAEHRGALSGQLATADLQWLRACEPELAHPSQEALRHNLPQWLADRLRKSLGAAEFEQLAMALLQVAPLDLRINTMESKREAVRQVLAAEGIPTQPTPFSPWGLRAQGKVSLSRSTAFLQGQVEVQDEGSQLLALLVDAKRGESVADFCAGGGGKTLALGAAMRNTGRLYAFDNSMQRLQGIKPRLQRTGLTNVHPTAISHEADARLDRLAGKLDRVLVDAPCTGLGTLRRHPDLKWRVRETDLKAQSALQLRILTSAARLLKPGGRLVYATCSLLEEENERVAEAFAADHPGFEGVAVSEELTRLKVADAAALCSQSVGRRVDDLRLWPHRHGTDGFYAAIWRKRP